MTNNKTIERLNRIAGPVSNKWRHKAQEILDSKEWKRDASIIAIRVLDRLEFLNWTQREFAKRLDVTPQAVTKIVKAKQNLTLGTIRKIEKVLETDLINLVGEGYTESITIEQQGMSIVSKGYNKRFRVGTKVTSEFQVSSGMDMPCIIKSIPRKVAKGA